MADEAYADAVPVKGREATARLFELDGRTALALSGLWTETLRLARDAGPGRLAVDCSGVSYLDGSGAALLLECAIVRGGGFGDVLELRGLAAQFLPLLERFSPQELAAQAKAADRGPTPFPLELGRKASLVLGDLRNLVSFLGQASQTMFWAARRPRTVRWKDVLATCETAGVNALPIIALIGFLMGLVMAFQSAVPLQRFGADIYVADLLGISMFRELGPLVTAILLAGRSGSAFAAEIGTMRVNEEIDALTTMGLDPLRFLAVPRIIAALVVTPILTIFFNLCALVGGGIVVRGLGYPLVTYINRVEASIHVGDVLGGLFKVLIFGMLVAGIGCQRGLATGQGPSAVGASTTSSVVTGLVAIAVADGVMAVVFYSLGV